MRVLRFYLRKPSAVETVGLTTGFSHLLLTLRKRRNKQGKLDKHENIDGQKLCYLLLNNSVFVRRRDI